MLKSQVQFFHNSTPNRKKLPKRFDSNIKNYKTYLSDIIRKFAECYLEAYDDGKLDGCKTPLEFIKADPTVTNNSFERHGGRCVKAAEYLQAIGVFDYFSIGHSYGKTVKARISLDWLYSLEQGAPDRLDFEFLSEKDHLEDQDLFLNSYRPVGGRWGAQNNLSFKQLVRFIFHPEEFDIKNKNSDSKTRASREMGIFPIHQLTQRDPQIEAKIANIVDEKEQEVLDAILGGGSSYSKALLDSEGDGKLPFLDWSGSRISIESTFTHGNKNSKEDVHKYESRIEFLQRRVQDVKRLEEILGGEITVKNVCEHVFKDLKENAPLYMNEGNIFAPIVNVLLREGIEA